MWTLGNTILILFLRRRKDVLRGNVLGSSGAELTARCDWYRLDMVGATTDCWVSKVHFLARWHPFWKANLLDFLQVYWDL